MIKTIIDFEENAVNQFVEWAGEYLNLPPVDNKRELVIPCIEKLIECGVFTEKELKAELLKNHISLHEKYFEGIGRNE